MNITPFRLRLLWSGGFDSTALLLEYLRRGDRVKVVYLPTHGGSEWQKTRNEQDARTRILHALPDAYRARLTVADPVPYDEQVYTAFVAHWGNLQNDCAGTWFSPQAALVAAAPGLLGTDVTAAYVSSDESLHAAPVLAHLRAAGVALPVLTATKAALWQHARHHSHDSLLHLTWSCEGDHDGAHPCGHCDPCWHRLLTPVSTIRRRAG